MQKKDREFSDRQWPKKFRALYADIVNEQLKREGIPNKRYDPRSYEEMGIAATPDNTPTHGHSQQLAQTKPPRPSNSGHSKRPPPDWPTAP